MARWCVIKKTPCKKNSLLFGNILWTYQSKRRKTGQDSLTKDRPLIGGVHLHPAWTFVRSATVNRNHGKAEEEHSSHQQEARRFLERNRQRKHQSHHSSRTEATAQKHRHQPHWRWVQGSPLESRQGINWYCWVLKLLRSWILTYWIFRI